MGGRPPTPPGTDRYWRRRVVALAAALAVVGVLTWACTGNAEEEGPAANAGDVPHRPPPTAMPTITVTRTVTPSPEPMADGGPCAAEDLVVSLTTSRDTYTGREEPRFRVSVVNTGESDCFWDAGPLDVRVTSGPDRIWSSAQCRHDSRPHRTLRRGIPYVDGVAWDRERGCKGDGGPARPGTYVASIKGAEKVIFHLR
ncbi:hypothetical protein AGRA3207_004680 [Actinomadura graeca]|uniref:DUF4232 domain-containing protein n=1 Tax=Actinomadura graeca TaxID=2750812 RepID=A0ABX8R0M2_9ACTN|nr:hypothetical protein [Actinomadura graeca]QXJ23512.1 hypothetical protein AGRA3207_004680 [Actinomadura graeca]